MIKLKYIKPAQLLAVMLILACSPLPDIPPEPEPEPEPELDFEIVIKDDGVLRWYSDPDFSDFILPEAWRDDVERCGDTIYPCVIASTVLNYQCTVLPDTIYGLIVRPYDKLFCVRDTCRSLRQDGVEYDIKAYRNNMLELCD
jgi:hypothetical protein